MDSDKPTIVDSNLDTELASNVVLTKKRLRRLIKDRFLQLSESELAAWSGRIVSRLREQQGWVGQGQCVAVFGGLKSEPDILPVLPWLWELGCQTVFFGIEECTLTPRLVSGREALMSGKFGAFEPDLQQGNSVYPVEEIDIVLTPGLAFDPAYGHRMGRGKGYYDRLFASEKFRARKIGVAFEMQCLTGIPMDSHDLPVDELVTEERWIQISS